MEDLKKLVIAYISKTQGKTPEEVSSLLFKTEADTEVLNVNALDGLFDWDKYRVNTQTTKFESEKKELYDKGFNKAKAESLSKFEKDLRDKYQIAEEKQGTELVDAILAKQSKDSGTGEPTDDQVKRSKTYLDTITNLKKERETAVKEWQDKYEGREKQLQREATFKSVSDDARTFVKSLNPILPEDQKKAEKQLSILIKELETEFDYEVKEDGKKILTKDGKVYCDEHGHPRSFEDVIKEKASAYWDFKKADEREGTGNKTNTAAPGANDKGYKGPVPKNDEEYNKLMSEIKDDAEGIAITKAWIASQPK